MTPIHVIWLAMLTADVDGSAPNSATGVNVMIM
jgi:hypothetical protein